MAVTSILKNGKEGYSFSRTAAALIIFMTLVFCCTITYKGIFGLPEPVYVDQLVINGQVHKAYYVEVKPDYGGIADLNGAILGGCAWLVASLYGVNKAAQAFQGMKAPKQPGT